MPEIVCVPGENRRGPPIGAACPKGTAKANGDGERGADPLADRGRIGERITGRVPGSRDRWNALPGHARYCARSPPGAPSRETWLWFGRDHNGANPILRVGVEQSDQQA